jgi:hypothetical protein
MKPPEIPYLVKDFHVLYSAALDVSESVLDPDRVSPPLRFLRAQLDRLRPLFEECDQLRCAPKELIELWYGGPRPPAMPSTPPATIEIGLMGKFMLMADDGAMVVRIGAATLALPVFSTVDKLQTALETLNFPPCDGFAMIQHPDALLASVDPNVQIILDPWLHESGSMRYLLLQRP